MTFDHEERLEKIFRENKNKGIAIAITGCWGVGKTFAWNKFIQQRAKQEEDNFKSKDAYERNSRTKIFSKKYAYISLFGIESLSDLKAAISTNMSSNGFNQESTWNLEVPSFLKKSLSALRDVKLSSSEYGVSSSAKIFEALLYSQVKDAIICFDDFERLSEKLKIQDVMGLANQLKLERNCQVVLILDESRTESGNQKKYAQYKEKLIDETIKITSVEPLLREKSKDMDKRLVDLMVAFADELEIHNFRFFQKVINLYKQFREQLPPQVAYSTKEIILIRVLQGYLIEDFGKELGITWEDFTFNNSLIRRQNINNPSKNGSTKSIFAQLEKISYKLVICVDPWSFEFKKWFDQREDIDFEILKELAQSELISEENNILKDHLRTLTNAWRNLEINPQYCEELFNTASKLAAIESLSMLNFTAYLLKSFGEPKLSKELKKLIISGLKARLDGNAFEVYEKYLRSLQGPETIFHRYIRIWRSQNPLKGLPSLLIVLKAELIQKSQLKYAEVVIKNTEEMEWENFIFIDAPSDVELSQFTIAGLIDEILKNPNINGVSGADLRNKIRNILNSRMEKSNLDILKLNYRLIIENAEKEGLEPVNNFV